MAFTETLYSYRFSATIPEEKFRGFLVEKLKEAEINPMVNEYEGTVTAIGIADFRKVIMLVSLFASYDKTELFFKAM